MSTVRADVVALMIDVESMADYPHLVRSSTGQPMTAEEVALVGSAGWPEFQAARDHFQRAADYAREAAAGFERVQELLRKYGLDDTKDVLHGEMSARMSPEDLAEVEELLTRFGGAS